MSVNDGKHRVTYQDIHVAIGRTGKKIMAEFKPDMMVAIAGGGLFPARVMRTFLKSEERPRNVPIQTIGLSLYEDLGPDISVGGTGLGQEEKIGKEVVRTQWLDKPILGRRILIVDEVDDSRTTLGYAVTELRKDIAAELAMLSPEEQAKVPETALAIFVVHNKLKTKRATLPSDVAYFSGEDVEDLWIEYPWEQQDILLHDSLAAQQKELGL